MREYDKNQPPAAVEETIRKMDGRRENIFFIRSSGPSQTTAAGIFRNDA